MLTNNQLPTDSSQNNSGNSGCGFIFLIASMIIAGIGIYISSMGTIIIGAFGAFIGIAIMSQSKVTVNPPANAPESSTGSFMQTTTYFNGIDPDFFDSVRYCGDKLYDFMQSINDDPRLREELIRAVHYTSVDNSLSFTELIKMLMASDILKIYRRLDYEIETDRKESFALIYLISRLHKMNSLTFDKLPLFYDRLVEILSNYLPILEKINADNEPSGALFLLGTLINNIDTETGKRYYYLLYRYASLIAKSDGTVTKKESDFLKSIMAARGNGSDETAAQTIENNPAHVEKNGMDRLLELIGLETVKSDVATLTNFIKIQNMRAAKGMKAPALSYHCVFTGNPGTGKTTVARILASIYKELGILKKGHLIETDRSGLVAEYVGQTAVKTNKIIDSAIGGVLFIDEAYSLVTGPQNDYGKEAIATLLKRMEDDRGRLVVILAGYTQEMQLFIDSNPGLQSRFNRYITFADYTEEELLKIFLSNLNKYDYTITDEATEKMKLLIGRAVVTKDHNFGNARWVRNIFEKTLEIQANRLATDGNISKDALTTITEYDIPIN